MLSREIVKLLDDIIVIFDNLSTLLCNLSLAETEISLQLCIRVLQEGYLLIEFLINILLQLMDDINCLRLLVVNHRYCSLHLEVATLQLLLEVVDPFSKLVLFGSHISKSLLVENLLLFNSVFETLDNNYFELTELRLAL
jgi:hypothetical protein